MVRLKYRYAIAELNFEDTSKLKETLTPVQIFRNIRESIALNFGDVGVAKTMFGLQVSLYDPKTHLAVIRCDRDNSELLLTSLCALTEVEGAAVHIRPVRVCGAIRTCQSNFSRLYVERLSPGDDTKTLVQQIQSELQKLGT